MSIDVRELSFAYGRRQVLRNVTFRAEPGQLVAVLGPNGAGKSTLFRCILGFLPRYRGDIALGGHALRSLDRRALARLAAYIPQTSAPVYNYTVRDTVLMGADPFHAPGRRQQETADRALEQLGIQDLWDRGVNEISGGERQLALIARAMARPKEDPLYVAAIGCPVNVASALLICPDLAHHIVVVWLGGTARYWNQGVEFNLMQDLHASRVLLNCGVPLIRFPTLNVVSHLMVTVPELQHYLGDCGDIGAYLCDIVAKYAQEEERAGGAYSKVIWDVAVLAYLVNPDWVYTTIHHSPILNDDCRFSFDNSRHFVREAVHVDRDGILTDLYRKLGSRKI